MAWIANEVMPHRPKKESSTTCFWEYKKNKNKKTVFLYFWNQKHVWLVEIKKYGFLRKK